MTTSVALCTYNGEKFLKEQLNNILLQSKTVDEIIICDDHSTDGTPEILNDYQEKWPALIKVFNNMASLGTIKNFEKAISLTKGDLIFLSDQDDIWMENKVARTSEFFSNNKTCKLFFTDGFLVGDSGESLETTLWEKWEFYPELRERWLENKNAFADLVHNHNKITGATVCFHKDLKKLGLPIEVPMDYWHDAWFGIHASAVDGLFFSDECLIKYRIHPNQQIGVSINSKKPRILNANENYIKNEEFLEKLWELYPRKMKEISGQRFKKEEGIVYKILRKFGKKEN